MDKEIPMYKLVAEHSVLLNTVSMDERAQVKYSTWK